MASTFHERKRPHPVLEASQRFDVREGQEVGAGGEELADLDEGRPHLLEVGRELLGELLLAGSGHRRFDEGLLEAGVLHQLGPPVLHEEGGDVLVSLEVLAAEEMPMFWSACFYRTGVVIRAGFRRRFNPPRTHRVEEEQDDADADRGVGQV